MKRQYAAAQRLAVLTGTHPHAFPNLGDPDQAWVWYRDNNPYATAALPRRHGFQLVPPGETLRQTDAAARARATHGVSSKQEDCDVTEQPAGYQLAHPVYLDVAMMISFLAYLEGGVVTHEEATQKEAGAKERILKGRAGLRARLPWALDAEAGSEGSSQRRDEMSLESEECPAAYSSQPVQPVV